MRALACVALLCVAPLALAQKSPTPAPKPLTVEIECATPDAEIDIDGQKVGTSPLPAPLPATPGEHTIKVTKPGFTPYIDVFKSDKKRGVKLQIELIPVAGVLKLSASVQGARVYVDGKFVGEAPITTEVPVGGREIKVEKGGFKDFTQNISAVAGQETNLDVQLEELPMGVNPYKPPPPPPPKWYEKWWVWTVGALGVGVVVTAVVVPAYLLTRDPIKDFCGGGSGCAGGVVTIGLMPVPK